MKEVKAIIQPFMLERVLEALRGIQALPGVTVSEVTSIGLELAQFDRPMKTKLEIMVPDAIVDTVLQAIQINAHTGNPGDGRIFVIPIEETIKIRTGERDTARPT
jgi:nitrogen regulatory protein P-II 1